jgi:hypothetical protein
MKRQLEDNINEESNLKITKRNPCDSPHTWQKTNSYYEKTFKRILSSDSLEEKYRRRKGEDKTTVHFGQRKLLVSEIEFLTIVFQNLEADNKKVVLIYAGAASGQHIPTLAEAFPFIEYILVDPAKFKINEKSFKSKVKILNEYFTNDMAKALRKDYENYIRLFVSDIRTANYRHLTRDMTEVRVEDDMISQMEWHRILEPYKSLLKFRLPYVGNVKTAKTELEYLDGTIFFQVWPGCTSSETRLMVDQGNTKKMYDCVKYENQLFRFNTVERLLCYEHEINIAGIDHCYDCRAEVHIIDQYIKIHHKLLKFLEGTNYKIPELSVAQFIEQININLNADSRFILFVMDRKNYGIKFTDFKYGATKECLLTNSALEKGKEVGYDISSDSDGESCNSNTQKSSENKNKWQPKRINHGVFQDKKQNYSNSYYCYKTNNKYKQREYETTYTKNLHSVKQIEEKKPASILSRLGPVIE